MPLTKMSIDVLIKKERKQVADACGSDMDAIPTVLLNGDQLVVGVCDSDTKAIPSCLLNDDRCVVDACGSDMNAIPITQRQSTCGRRLRVRYESHSFLFVQR